jgi:hypothetical protein
VTKKKNWIFVDILLLLKKKQNTRCSTVPSGDCFMIVRLLVRFKFGKPSNMTILTYTLETGMLVPNKMFFCSFDKNSRTRANYESRPLSDKQAPGENELEVWFLQRKSGTAQPPDVVNRM